MIPLYWVINMTCWSPELWLMWFIGLLKTIKRPALLRRQNPDIQLMSEGAQLCNPEENNLRQGEALDSDGLGWGEICYLVWNNNDWAGHHTQTHKLGPSLIRQAGWNNTRAETAATQVISSPLTTWVCLSTQEYLPTCTIPSSIRPQTWGWYSIRRARFRFSASVILLLNLRARGTIHTLPTIVQSLTGC